MAKLSQVQKNNIIAKWNTGQYTKVQIAKAYKVTEKVIRELVGKEPPSNADIVEAGVFFEKAKKSDKSTSEINAIEQAIKYRLEQEYTTDKNRIKVYDITTDILNGVQDLIKGKKAKKIVTEWCGKGLSTSREMEIDLQAIDYKTAMDTVDKASITLGVNERFSSKVEVNNANVQEIEEKRVTIIRRSDNLNND